MINKRQFGGLPDGISGELSTVGFDPTAQLAINRQVEEREVAVFLAQTWFGFSDRF